MATKIFFDSINDIPAIQNLIDTGIPENEHLDYIEAKHNFAENPKAKDREDNIAKIACAMANSGGGTIIYGVDTDRQVPEKPTKITGVDAKNLQIIDDVIKSQINPTIVGYELKPIPRDTPQVILLYIPDSDMVPHQSAYNDKTFYGRKGSSSVPLDVHAIQQLFNRRKVKLETAPILFMDIFHHANKGTTSVIKLYLLNKGLSPAINIKVIENRSHTLLSYPCLGANETIKMEDIQIQNLGSDGITLYEIKYTDIMNANYVVQIGGGRDGHHWKPCQKIVSFKKDGVQLIP